MNSLREGKKHVMAKKYRICFQVTAELLPTVVSLLSSEVGALTIEEVKKDETHRETTVTKTGITRKHGNRDLAEQEAVKLVLSAIQHGANERQTLKETLVKAGYSPNTISPTISKALKAGLISFSNQNGFQIV
jgi:hypothetical protein